MEAYLTFQTHLSIAVFVCRPDRPGNPDLFLLPLSTFSLKNSSRSPTTVFLFLYLTIVGNSCLLEGLKLEKRRDVQNDEKLKTSQGSQIPL